MKFQSNKMTKNKSILFLIVLLLLISGCATLMDNNFNQQIRDSTCDISKTSCDLGCHFYHVNVNDDTILQICFTRCEQTTESLPVCRPK